MRFILFVFGTWFVLMILAIFNALLRTEGYGPYMSELQAHQLSTIIFIFMIIGVIFILVKHGELKLDSYHAVLIGVIWLVFTIVFEFIAGHYIFGNSWNRLINDYNIFNGRVWSLVLVTILFAPLGISKISNN